MLVHVYHARLVELNQYLQQFPEAAGCPKCKASFSLVEGNTKIPAHAGPTNTRLRAHLGLVVPKKGDVHKLNIG